MIHEAKHLEKGPSEVSRGLLVPRGFMLADRWEGALGPDPAFLVLETWRRVGRMADPLA